MTRAGLCFIAIAAAVTIGCGSENEGASSPTGPSSPTSSSNPPPQSSCTAPPAAPSNLRVATQNGSQITLEWSASSGATQYEVIVGTTPSSSNTLLTNTGQNSYTFTAPTGTHYARVQAKNACGSSAASNEITFFVSPQ
jgi:Fibronectin type III domain.